METTDPHEKVAPAEQSRAPTRVQAVPTAPGSDKMPTVAAVSAHAMTALRTACLLACAMYFIPLQLATDAGTRVVTWVTAVPTDSSAHKLHFSLWHVLQVPSFFIERAAAMLVPHGNDTAAADACRMMHLMAAMVAACVADTLFNSRAMSPDVTAAALCLGLLSLLCLRGYVLCLDRQVTPTFQGPLQDKQPLGVPCRSDVDARLQTTARITVQDGLVFVLAGFLIRTDQGTWCTVTVASAAAWFFFWIQNIPVEYLVHWDMHCGVLVNGLQAHSPWLTRVLRCGVQYIVSPLLGYIPTLYKASHLLVHHAWDSAGYVEHTETGDPTSLLPYRRHSPLEFGVFVVWFTFLGFTGADVLWMSKNVPRAVKLSTGLHIVAFWIIVVALISCRRALGFWLCGAVIGNAYSASVVQMLWHALLDPTCAEGDPLALYRNTLEWVVPGQEQTPPEEREKLPADHPYWSFTGQPSIGGHHVTHHALPAVGPDRILATWDSIKQEAMDKGTIVLRNEVGNQFAWYMHVLSGDLPSMASMVYWAPTQSTKDEQVDNNAQSQQATMELMASRMEPGAAVRSAIAATSVGPCMQRLDAQLTALLRFSAGLEKMDKNAMDVRERMLNWEAGKCATCR